MTRRERLEGKMEKLEQWAESRRRTASGLLASTRKYDGDYAFNTQPGHIPERARVIRRQDKAFEHLREADHHAEKAAGLAAQLDRTIYSDDPDALEQLAARLAELEAKADRYGEINKAWKRGGAPAVEAAFGRAAAVICTENMAPGYSWIKSPMDAKYLRADIRRLRERMKDIEGRQARVAVAEAAGGVTVARSGDGKWCTVTFAEKPSRTVLEALKGAGYHWGAGSWSGYLDRLPAEISQLA